MVSYFWVSGCCIQLQDLQPSNSMSSEAGSVIHVQAKHARVMASYRNENERLSSQLADLRVVNQSLRAETQKLHSNLATMQMQQRHYQQQVQ